MLASMSAEASGRPDIDALVAELRARVDERRRTGEYPAGMDGELDRHWQAVSAALPASRVEALARRLDVSADFGRHRISMDSSVPLGSQLHRMVGRATTRQTDGLVRQMREFGDATRAMFDALIDALPARGHESVSLMNRMLRRLDMLEEEVAAMRHVGAPERAVADLAARLEPLERARAAQDFRPWFSQRDFEAAFRGTREAILEAYRPLVARFAGCGPVLDLGCGLGEVLELFAELGVEAHGVDIDADLVDLCVARGLSATAEEGVAYLESLPDHSLGGLFSAQVVEHLQPQELANLVAVASQKLREGGLIVLETINVQSLYVYAHSYPIDPTHVRPVAPVYLEFLVRQAGFREVYIEWRTPVGEEDRLEPLDSGDAPGLDDPGLLDEPVARNFARLQRLLFAEQDYAVIGVR